MGRACGGAVDVQRWCGQLVLLPPSPATAAGLRREPWPGTFHAPGCVLLRSGTVRASGDRIPVPDGVECPRSRERGTDGEINVTLRRGDDPATVTPERAFELLAEKRAKGPTKKRTTRKTAAKKTTTKKTAAKKTATKKTATKTTTRKTAASKES